MLILGRKYKFTKFEKYRLKKAKFKTTTVRYRKRPPEEVLEELKALEDKHSIIVINTKDKVDDRIVKYLTQLQLKKDVAIISIEKFVEKYLYKCYIPEDDADLNYLSDIRPYSAFEYVQKRIVDYLAVFVIFFLSWPVLLYARYRIKKESPGTSMFKQYRVGLNNKKFKCYKFRSMHKNSHHDPYTRKNDSRIFKWGKIMRKTRIDELPQLLNVLKGDMHFVGPRAEWEILVDEYEKEIPYYSERHLVRPGITGWAQVMYPYGSNAWDAKQKLMYDLYYIKHWSIWLEIKIIFKTIGVVLGRKGI